MNIEELRLNGKVYKKTQIKTKFRGFRRDRLFPLTNNEFWIQKEYKYWYHYSFRPNVTIYELSGNHYLTLDGQNEFTEIKRITDVKTVTIISDFNGWSGDTIFEMDNGEIWKQDEYEYEYNYSYRPTAIIYYDGMNYRMLVEDSSIQVKKLK